MSQEQLDDAYDFLWEANGNLRMAMVDWRAGDYEGALNRIVGTINLLDGVQNILRPEVEP